MANAIRVPVSLSSGRGTQQAVAPARDPLKWSAQANLVVPGHGPFARAARSGHTAALSRGTSRRIRPVNLGVTSRSRTHGPWLPST